MKYYLYRCNVNRGPFLPPKWLQVSRFWPVLSVLDVSFFIWNENFNNVNYLLLNAWWWYILNLSESFLSLQVGSAHVYLSYQLGCIQICFCCFWHWCLHILSIHFSSAFSNPKWACSQWNQAILKILEVFCCFLTLFFCFSCHGWLTVISELFI